MSKSARIRIVRYCKFEAYSAAIAAAEEEAEGAAGGQGFMTGKAELIAPPSGGRNHCSIVGVQAPTSALSSEEQHT